MGVVENALLWLNSWRERSLRAAGEEPDGGRGGARGCQGRSQRAAGEEPKVGRGGVRGRQDDIPKV